MFSLPFSNVPVVNSLLLATLPHPVLTVDDLFFFESKMQFELIQMFQIILFLLMILMQIPM